MPGTHQQPRISTSSVLLSLDGHKITSAHCAGRSGGGCTGSISMWDHHGPSPSAALAVLLADRAAQVLVATQDCCVHQEPLLPGMSRLTHQCISFAAWVGLLVPKDRC